MSNKKSSGDGTLGIFVIVFGIFAVLFGWFVRSGIHWWKSQDPYTPQSLYVAKQVYSSRRYWVVLVGGYIFALFALFSWASVLSEITIPLVILFTSIALVSGFYFRPRPQVQISSVLFDEALRYHRQELTRAKTYRIYPPKKAPDYTAMSKLMGELLSTMPRLYFRVVGTPEAIYWEIVDPTGTYYPQTIKTPLLGNLGTETAIEERIGLDPEIPARLPFYRDQLYFRLTNDYVAPFTFPTSFKFMTHYQPSCHAWAY